MVFFALVFLTMMLRVGKEIQKQKTKKKNQEQTALERVRAQKSYKITIYMMHVMSSHIMHALLH